MQDSMPHSGDFVNAQHAEFLSEIPLLARANLKKIFTPPGTSNANLQQNRFKKVAGGAMDLFKGYSPWMQSMTPELLQRYQTMFDLGSQRNAANAIEAMRRRSMMNGLMANRAAMKMYGNKSLAQGAGISAMNKGMDASNLFMGQQYDPAVLMAQMAQSLGQMQTPLQNYTSLASTIYGQPQVPVGPGPLDYAMQLSGIAKNVGWQPGARG